MNFQAALHPSQIVPRTGRMMIALAFGVVVGLLLRISPVAWQSPIVDLLDLGGQAFVKLMQTVFIPIIVVFLLSVWSSAEETQRLMGLMGKSLAFYLIMTVSAILMALFFAESFQIGAGASLQGDIGYGPTYLMTAHALILGLVPNNLIQSIMNGDMMPVILFSLILGLALAGSGASGRRVAAFFDDLHRVLINLTLLIMKISPYGVFCLVAKLMATLHFDLLSYVMSYFLLVLLVLVVQLLVVYPLWLCIGAKLNPIVFFKKLYPALLMTFSMASTYVSLPVTMERVRQQLGVDNEVGSLVLPLGVALHKDGTAILQVIAAIFIAHAHGVELEYSGYLSLITMTLMASISTGGLPGAGLATLVLLLDQLGLPKEGIGLVVGVDRILDMVRSVVNMTGNAVICALIARSEGKLDSKVYHGLSTQG